MTSNFQVGISGDRGRKTSRFKTGQIACDEDPAQVPKHPTVFPLGTAVLLLGSKSKHVETLSDPNASSRTLGRLDSCERARGSPLRAPERRAPFTASSRPSQSLRWCCCCRAPFSRGPWTSSARRPSFSPPLSLWLWPSSPSSWPPPFACWR